jgi:hypothetical protein
MHRNQTLLLLALVVGLLQIAPPRSAAASSEDAEMRRKTEEVERLRQQLQRAEEDLKRLQSRESKPAEVAPPQAPVPAPAAAPPPSVPAPPVPALPPLQPGEVIDAGTLIGHFQADPAQAESRYRKQTFALRGEVLRFNPKLARRAYDVILVSPDPRVELVCSFGYEEPFRSVYTRERGRTLVARLGETSAQTLWRVGQTTVIRGRCAGLKDGVIHFTRCARVP